LLSGIFIDLGGKACVLSPSVLFTASLPKVGFRENSVTLEQRDERLFLRKPTIHKKPAY
jgi:hypothetical protein